MWRGAIEGAFDGVEVRLVGYPMGGGTAASAVRPHHLEFRLSVDWGKVV